MIKEGTLKIIRNSIGVAVINMSIIKILELKNNATECCRCRKPGHFQDCRVMIEEAKCGLLLQRDRDLPEWCKTVRSNEQEM